MDWAMRAGRSSAMAVFSMVLPLLVGPPLAHAQTVQPSEALEEVIVTAQRRDENLQLVPQTVDVITAADASNQGITKTIDLTTAVPGLQFNQQANSAIPFIR